MRSYFIFMARYIYVYIYISIYIPLIWDLSTISIYYIYLLYLSTIYIYLLYLSTISIYYIYLRSYSIYPYSTNTLYYIPLWTHTQLPSPPTSHPHMRPAAISASVCRGHSRFSTADAAEPKSRWKVSWGAPKVVLIHLGWRNLEKKGI